jgi:hypothetical protein
MTTRALVCVAALVAATASPLAQTAPPAPPAIAQPGTAPRARGGIPPPSGEPRTLTPPADQPRPLTPPAAAERPRREGQPVNLKVELTLTDQRGGATPIKRVVTILTADGFTGSIRTQSSLYRMSEIPLNVDASPTLLADGKIRVSINLQYDWPAPIEAGKDIPVGTVTRTALHDSLMMILENGKPMIVAQSADPVGDRQVTVEVKATILR